jgi:hypothetical protein
MPASFPRRFAFRTLAGLLLVAGDVLRAQPVAGARASADSGATPGVRFASGGLRLDSALDEAA